MSERRRILVVGPSWVGDMVMAQSLFITLQQQGDVQIDVLAPAWSLPILQRMPQVHQGIAMPLGHGQLGLRTRWQLGRQLARAGYQQAIVLPGSLKSALVPWFAGIPQRTGFTGEQRYGLLNDRRPLDKQVLPMTVQRFVALGLPRSAAASTAPEFPPPSLVADAANAARLRERLGLQDARPAVAFMPGAEYGPAKQWPAPHFAQLARDLMARGQQVWVLGSAKDRDIGQAIADSLAPEQAPQLHMLCGQTELGDVVDLLSLCAGAVSNDSGLMHIAAALGIPLVAIYGSSDPRHTPPLSPSAKALSLNLPCAPCFERRCPLGHTRCLNELLPQQVLQALP